MKRVGFAVTVALAASVAGCQPAATAPAEKLQAAPAPPLAESVKAAVARGLDALVGMQAADGSFGWGTSEAHAGITALAGLALLESGADGAYARNVSRVTDFLVNHRQKNGVLVPKGDAGVMYGHGFAMLYLSQVYATTKDAALRAKLKTVLEEAVKLSETAQNQEGGWRYQPTPLDADVSVTAGQLRALLAVDNAGIKVNRATIDRALAYIKSVQAPDGGFKYIVGVGDSGWARSAAAVATLLYVGARDDRVTLSGIKYLKTAPAGKEYTSYGNYYLAQALNLGGDKRGLSWADLEARVLSAQDKKTGQWTGEAGPAYATATALIALQMKDTKLPAFTQTR